MVIIMAMVHPFGTPLWYRPAEIRGSILRTGALTGEDYTPYGTPIGYRVWVEGARPRP